MADEPTAGLVTSGGDISPSRTKPVTYGQVVEIESVKPVRVKLTWLTTEEMQAQKDILDYRMRALSGDLTPGENLARAINQSR